MGGIIAWRNLAPAALLAVSRRRDVLDISSPLNDAAAAIVDDSFLRCFKSLVGECLSHLPERMPVQGVGTMMVHLPGVLKLREHGPTPPHQRLAARPLAPHPCPADEPWNWNIYLLPLWCLGVLIRNCILFPLR